MEIQQEYQRWCAFAAHDPQLKAMLETLEQDPEQLQDSFYQELHFGTGGLRGKIGAGSNRMNIYTVGKTTQGLAEYLLNRYAEPSVCIAYDTRHMSLEFAQTAAGVMAANGIKVYLFDATRPTPMLSFAVRYLKASCGIVITASHNPKEYNGYKVYNASGGQLTDEAAAAVYEKISQCDVFEDVKLMPPEQALASGILNIMDGEVDLAYYSRVEDLILRKAMVRDQAKSLRVVYTPLHGSGNIPVRRVLQELGFSNLFVVPEQELPDGDFPTAPYPNPEDPAVFQLAIRLAQKNQADLVFATDPDCDRIGVLVQDDKGQYSVLTGNQTGALLCDYILKTCKELDVLPENGAVVTTVVSTDLVERICEAYGVSLLRVLTGFKYIGEKVGEWARDHSHRFLLGFEESYGYLCGDFVRDKDAVIAAAMIAEMALYYKNQGKSLYQAMQEIYRQYGNYAERLVSITMPGQDGQEKIRKIMEDLRENYSAQFATEEIVRFSDFQRSMSEDVRNQTREQILLPKSNVIKIHFADGAWLVLRPSGTEPKIKLYLSACQETMEGTQQRLSQLEQQARKLVQ